MTQRRRNHIYLLLAMVAAWAAVLAAFALARHARLNSSTFDLGIKAQVIWNTFQGDWFASSIEVKHYLGDHVQLIFVLIAPLFALWEDVGVLLILQAVVLSLGAIPVFRIATRKLGSPRLGLLWAAVYLLYPLIGFVNRFDFHPVVFTIPLFLLAFDLLESDHPVWASVAILLALSLREEVGLTVFAFGLYVAIFMRRPRLGLAWALAGLVWSAVAIFVVIPYFRGDASDTVFRYGWLGNSPGEMAIGLVTKPGLVIAHLTEPFRLLVPVKLLLPVGFLALLAPAPLLVTLPSLAYNLLSETPSQSSIYFQYLAPAVAFIFIAGMQGAAKLRGWLPERWATWGVTAVLLSGTLLAWLWDNPFTQAIGEPYWEVYALEQFTNGDAFYAAAELLPRDAEVATMMAYGPHLALRPELSLFYDRLQLLERPFGFPQADYLLLNLSDWRWGVNARLFLSTVEAAIGRFGYEAIYARDDVVLLQRGVPPSPLTGVVLQRVIELLDAGGKFAPTAPETLDWMGREWLVESVPPTAQALTAEFEHGITLLGVEAPDTAVAGDPVCATLYWTSTQPIDTDYTVFLHLSAPDGFVSAQRDGAPAQGFRPTSAWQPGDILADLRCVRAPEGLAPGDYTFTVGLYHPETGARVALVSGGDVVGDTVVSPAAVEIRSR